MFHCHIFDHAEAGLMSTVDVGDIDAPHGAQIGASADVFIEDLDVPHIALARRFHRVLGLEVLLQKPLVARLGRALQPGCR